MLALADPLSEHLRSVSGLEAGQVRRLDYIVQELRRFPGKGWALVRTALASPIIRCRNMGMMALSIWGREHWPDDAEAALRAAMLREPDERLRLNLGRLLSGQQIK